MPDPEPIRHPTTGEPIAIGPGEQLYRLARPSCQTWNPVDGLRFEPLATGSALAEVLAEGKVKGGYYWQKVSASKGTCYLCRSTTDSRIQKAVGSSPVGRSAAMPAPRIC